MCWHLDALDKLGALYYELGKGPTYQQLLIFESSHLYCHIQE
jgi:hypothetical protein